MSVPPGIDEKRLASALEKFRRVVGSEWVFAGGEDLETYRDPYSVVWGEKEETRPSAAVAPASVEQVQGIVRIANEYGIPLYSISTGKNLGYGTNAPNHSGSVILDLKRLNRILQVDDKRHFCIVEPGVSYYDLYSHLQANGFKLLMDLPSNPMGGPVGNSIDRGVGYSANRYRDHFSSVCGMEVVLPNGELLRTGMAAVPGADSWADFKYGYGPYVDGLFSQGNLGIVTKMGLWLMPQPEHFLSTQVSVPRYLDIVPLVETVNYLEDSFLVGYVRYNSPMEIPRVQKSKPDPDLVAIMLQPGGGQPEEYERYAKQRNMPYWTATLNYYGPKATVAANWAYTKERLGNIPGVKFSELESCAFPLKQEELAKVKYPATVGVPNLASFALGTRSRINTEPSDGHIWFSPVIPRTGEAVIQSHKVFGEAFKELGIPARMGPYSGPRTWMYRSFVMMLDFYTSRTDKKANRQVYEAFKYLVEVGAKHGWAEYRTAPLFQDQVAATYSFNNHALRRFNETLKDAVDPKGILSPGRGGIWPRHLREGWT
ncbi:FAD-binding oxidoreductase [Azotobacter beijerinckii]|uniref:FAD-binding oxidoreductase n=1 Tax=Azotobacter beijerinckii TaxID=170623 RepID=UPI002955B6CC|nr:FAD-binding oxidoreductase [Azotobacter beijerinckii]MDV7212897.1 FAD-binding oxidoreductase [Azotobacter beijerinckii]